MNRATSAILTLCVLIGPLAGCIENAEGPFPVHTKEGVARPPRVVAVIDSGLNPYHAAFQASKGDAVEMYAPQMGATVVNLSGSGDYTARLEQDGGMWDSLEPGRLYAFAGTRAMGISFGQGHPGPVVLDYVPAGHGTSVASAVLQADPDAFVLVVQVDARLCDTEELSSDCPRLVELAHAMEWIAEQPAIAVVSLSLNYHANVPLPEQVPTVRPYLEAAQRAFESGKVIVNSAGNYVAPPVASHLGGPPWMISVGGAQEAQRGDTAGAAKGPDVLGPFNIWGAMSGTTEDYGWRSGTSFAAPTVAGTLSRAIGLLHEQGIHPVPLDQLRTALNASALTWAAEDWRPLASSSNTTFDRIFETSFPSLTPAQTGWGFVNASLAPDIARRVLEQDFSIPPEKANTAAYMARWQAAREAYWANAP